MATPDLWRVERLQPLEGDLEHQALVAARPHLAHRAEAVDRVVAHEAVELVQFLVGEAEIGLADRHQRSPSVAVQTPNV